MDLWQRKPSQASGGCSKDVVVSQGEPFDQLSLLVGFAGGRSSRGGYCVWEDEEEETTINFPTAAGTSRGSSGESCELGPDSTEQERLAAIAGAVRTILVAIGEDPEREGLVKTPMRVAKATLEGALRGVLATMTPEEVNDNKALFADRLIGNAEKDMQKLGLVIDTLNVQSVHDEVDYLDSIGRQKNADISRKSRIAEAEALRRKR